MCSTSIRTSTVSRILRCGRAAILINLCVTEQDRRAEQCRVAGHAEAKEREKGRGTDLSVPPAVIRISTIHAIWRLNRTTRHLQ
jgi:hypothetical protein